MTTCHRVLALVCCVTACDPSDLGDDGASDESNGSSDDSAASSDDDDTAPSDDDTADPSADTTGGNTGDPPPGDALPDSVFLYLHDDGSWADSVHAYDIATDQTWLVTDLGGDVEIRSVAIHPDRTSLAISAYYELTSPSESEGIWRVPIAGGTPEAIMNAIPGRGDEGQNIAYLAYSWDGAEIWFDYSNSASGGGMIGRVADAGGDPEFFGDSNGSCLGNDAPAPGPSGTQLVTVRASCQDLALEGLVALDLPPSGLGQVIVPEGDIYDLASIPAQWSADGSALMFVVGTRIDLDGDAFYDGQGDELLAMSTATGDLFEVVPPAIDQRIFGFAISPDESRIVLCMGTATGEDLVLLDLSGETPSYRQLTSDGSSCRVAW